MDGLARNSFQNVSKCFKIKFILKLNSFYDHFYLILPNSSILFDEFYIYKIDEMISLSNKLYLNNSKTNSISVSKELFL